MASLKQDRTNSKRSLTNAIKSIREKVVFQKFDLFDHELQELSILFQNFSSVCDKFRDSLTEDDHLESADQYYDDVSENYLLCIQYAQSSFSDFKSATANAQPSLAPVAALPAAPSTLESSVHRIMCEANLPKLEIEKFSGDPSKFHMFMKSFDANVDLIAQDDSAKLSRLVQYVTGPARESIRGTLLIGGGEGYRQARSILEDRFGNAYLVSDNVVRHLRYGNPVKSAKELQQLSDDVKNAKAILSNLEMLDEISSTSLILDIVSRLQSKFQNRWQKIALDKKCKTKRYPKFDDLSVFLADQAERLADPVYGENYMKKDKQVSMNSTTTGNPSTKLRVSFSECAFCKLVHRTYNCPDFLKLSVASRWDEITKRGLCVVCLSSNHKTELCPSNYTCSMDGCGGRHSRVLHRQSLPPSPNSPPITNGSVTACTDSTKTSFMPIVPVRVNHGQIAYALLDTGSTSSFCSRSLVDKLGISGNPKSLNLSTLSDSVLKQTEVVELSLFSIDRANSLSMNNVFVIDKIPVSCASHNEVSLHHLKDLDLPDLSRITEVDLLIGQDHSAALLPLEIKSGCRGDPFAIRGLFGWSLNGSTPTYSKVNHLVISHTVEVCSESDGIGEDMKHLWDFDEEFLRLSLIQCESFKDVSNVSNYKLPVSNVKVSTPVIDLGSSSAHENDESWDDKPASISKSQIPKDRYHYTVGYFLVFLMFFGLMSVHSLNSLSANSNCYLNCSLGNLPKSVYNGPHTFDIGIVPVISYEVIGNLIHLLTQGVRLIIPTVFSVIDFASVCFYIRKRRLVVHSIYTFHLLVDFFVGLLLFYITPKRVNANIPVGFPARIYYDLEMIWICSSLL